MSKDKNPLLQKILEFRQQRDWEQFHIPANLAKSISIEAGELLECFQWSNDNYNLQAIREEVADIYIYLLYLCHDLDIDLHQATLDKVAINFKKYPIAKSRGKSTKSNQL